MTGAALILALTVAPAPRGSGAPPCVREDADAALPEVRTAYVEAFNEGGIDDVVGLHAEDVVSMPEGVPLLRGREPLRELMAASLQGAPEGFRFHFEAREVRAGDGWGVERGVTRAELDGEGGGIPGGTYVLLHERDREGCWRIAWSVTNSDRPRR